MQPGAVVGDGLPLVAGAGLVLWLVMGCRWWPVLAGCCGLGDGLPLVVSVGLTLWLLMAESVRAQTLDTV